MKISNRFLIIKVFKIGVWPAHAPQGAESAVIRGASGNSEKIIEKSDTRSGSVGMAGPHPADSSSTILFRVALIYTFKY